MELRHLRYFVAVADELNFGRAAARLHMTQPPLSKQIRDLEAELGVTLFDRSRRQVRLTRVGAEIVEEARRLVRQVEGFGHLAAEAARGRVGHLRVGVVHSSLYGVVPTILRRFREAHPRVRLTVHEAVTSELVDELMAGHLDVAFTRPDVFPDEVERTTLLMETLHVALPAHHPLSASAGPVTIADLRGDPIVLFPRELGAGYWDLVVGAYQQAGITPRIDHLADQVATMVGLVAAGLGVSIVPEAVRNLALPGVTYRPLEPRLELALTIAWHRDADIPARRVFVSVAEDIAAARGTGGGVGR